MILTFMRYVYRLVLLSYNGNTIIHDLTECVLFSSMKFGLRNHRVHSDGWWLMHDMMHVHCSAAFYSSS